jgi:malonyl-CoA/methylmalonyl-CoA synthetase
MSYAELAVACAGHFRALEAAGVQSGDRVAVWTEPSMATVVALVGNALAGVVSVPLNPHLGERELAHVVRDAEPSVAFAAEPGAAAARVPHLPTRGVSWGGGPGLRPPTGRSVDGEPLLILYTSGTTGPPKGAVITARNVASNIDALSHAWQWSEHDTVVHALPLFHVHGLVLGLLGSLRVGGGLAWVPRFDPTSLAMTLREEGTVLFAVPTMIHRMVEAAEQGDTAIARALGGARLLVSGSAGLPLREHRRLERIAGRSVHERYGLTETLIDCAVPASGPARPGYVGPPVAGVELRVVGDDGTDLPWDDHSIGEVQVRGPNVFAGYLGQPTATRAVLGADGWFRTGDLAARAPDGAVRLVGRRATDLIKTGGYKVGAGEVESALLEDPGVREVAVLGTPDDDLGERIVAFVVPTDPAAPPDAQGLADRVAHDLAPHKRPRDVHLLDALPRNAMGKVQKAVLRGRLIGGG